jgi:hypothetical protein
MGCVWGSLPPCERDVRYWHKADISIASMNVRFWGKADITKVGAMSVYDPKRALGCRLTLHAQPLPV